VRKNHKLEHDLWFKTFLSLVSPVNLQGIVNLKSSKLRKPCKFTVDTKDRKICKPEQFSRRFSGCNFSIFLGDTICIYLFIYSFIFFTYLFIYFLIYLFIYLLTLHLLRFKIRGNIHRYLNIIQYINLARNPTPAATPIFLAFHNIFLVPLVRKTAITQNGTTSLTHVFYTEPGRILLPSGADDFEISSHNSANNTVPTRR